MNLKRKDFLQVIVKDEDSQLPTDQNVAQLVEDLRSEIQNARRTPNAWPNDQSSSSTTART